MIKFKQMALPPEWDQIVEQANVNLVAFLRTDIDLGFTLIDRAKIKESSEQPARAERCLHIVRSVVEGVRRFQPRIADQEIRRQIERRCDELENALASFVQDE